MMCGPWQHPFAQGDHGFCWQLLAPVSELASMRFVQAI
jgi:hypothetical protein